MGASVLLSRGRPQADRDRRNKEMRPARAPDMAAHHSRDRRAGTKERPFSFWNRLKEIDMFFQKNDPVYQTLRRLVKRLERVGIPYAVMGAMAVNYHGARRTTDDVDVLR